MSYQQNKGRRPCPPGESVTTGRNKEKACFHYTPFRSISKKTEGFTLIEIVLVILITSVLIVLLFQALHTIRDNEARFQQKRDEEKNVYVLFNALSNLFKNMSAVTVFNNRENALYFLGGSDGVIFLSREPLIYPYGGLHFIELRYEKGVLMYREKPFREEDGKQVTFEALRDEPFSVLLDDVDVAAFQYYMWDGRRRRFLWRDRVNTYDKDVLPLRVALRVRYGAKDYDLLFEKVIKDKDEQYPMQAAR